MNKDDNLSTPIENKNISEMDRKVNGDAKPFTRILNIIALIIDRGRLTMYLLIIATAVLGYFNRIPGDDIKFLFIIYSSLAVGGEAVVGEILSRWMGPPKVVKSN